MVRGKAFRPPPNSKPAPPYPPPYQRTSPHPFFSCCWRAWVLKGKPQLVPRHNTNPLPAAIGGMRSGVLMLRLGEETLVNLPIACHRPWPGLFVSGTPLIGPSTPSSVYSLPAHLFHPRFSSRRQWHSSQKINPAVSWEMFLIASFMDKICIVWQLPFVFHDRLDHSTVVLSFRAFFIILTHHFQQT